MNSSETLTKIIPAMIAAQKLIKAIPKNAKNPFYKSDYATLDEIIRLTKGILLDNDINVFQSTRHIDTNFVRTTIKEQETHVINILFYVETTLIHASGEWFSSVVPISVDKATCQGMGSGLSYGRRYGLSTALNLATETDDDGNNAEPIKQSKMNERPGSTDSIEYTKHDKKKELVKEMSGLLMEKIFTDDDRADFKKGIAQIAGSDLDEYKRYLAVWENKKRERVELAHTEDIF